MNREILFRGKRIDNGGWWYGSYRKIVHIDSGSCQCYKDCDCFSRRGEKTEFYRITDDNGRTHRVDPATVGQFTGLHDKNGTRIWEGDIVDVPDLWCGGKYKVVWCDEDASFKLTQDGKTYLYIDTGLEKGGKVIG